MKKLFILSLLFFYSLIINSQTLAFKDFEKIMLNNNLQDIMSTIDNLGFNFESVNNTNNSNSICWAYNCNYDKQSDVLSYYDDKFWSILLLEKNDNVNSFLSLTFNKLYGGREYFNKFSESLKLYGFVGETKANPNFNMIVTYYVNTNSPFIVAVEQSKDTYSIRFAFLK